jgi:hypothetical protein
MAVRLNHTIVAAHDHEASSKFLTEILGLPPPLRLGPFAIVTVGDTSLDYMNVKDYRGADGEIVSQHYAFLVTEAEFDEIFARIRERHLPYWADPGRSQRNQINEWDGGRGSTSKIPTGMFSKRSRDPTAAVARRRLDRIRCSRQTRTSHLKPATMIRP